MRVGDRLQSGLTCASHLGRLWLFLVSSQRKRRKLDVCPPVRIVPLLRFQQLCSSLWRSSELDWRTRLHDPGVCAAYGICGHRVDGDVLNCAHNTEAQPVRGGVAEKLQQICPQLVAEYGGEGSRYCCSEEQIDVLTRQVAAPVNSSRHSLFNQTLLHALLSHIGHVRLTALVSS